MNCDVCGKCATRACSRCKCAAYCSEKCAECDWGQGGHYLECFAHDETVFEEIAKDLELGAHIIYDVPLEHEEVQLGHEIIARGDIREAIEWLSVNRVIHTNPDTPTVAQELFDHRSDLIGATPQKKESWWAKRKRERTAKKMNKILSLEEERNKSWNPFKRARLRRQQKKELKKGVLF